MNEFYAQYEPKEKKKFSYLLNIALFFATFISTMLAGVAWQNLDPYDIKNFSAGLLYAFLIMLIISTHEFGHYFASKHHNVDVTLPYYIPFPFIFLNPFGTMGAVIKMKSPANYKRSLFDIGIAGPLAGWVTTIIILIIGYASLPPVEYLYSIHPEYAISGIPLTGLTFGDNLIFMFFRNFVHLVNPNAFIPPMNEVYHYPFLCAGWFGLLITSLNMMPVGQLDGGHISYTMFGSKHKMIANVIFVVLLIFGTLGALQFVFPKIPYGSLNWLVWAGLLKFFVKLHHPDVCYDIDLPLDDKRTFLGWFAFFIFIISLCPVPIIDN